jgi:hypothetical protein
MRSIAIDDLRKELKSIETKASKAALDEVTTSIKTQLENMKRDNLETK